MLSIRGLGKAGVKDKKGRNGLDYLKSTEYYTNGQGETVSPAEWTGKGAAILGLEGRVDYSHLDALSLGFDKDGKTPLVKGAGERHRIGHDLTFSADKSVSIVLAFADGQTKAAILEAHQRAVDRAIEYIEKHAITRVGRDGVDRQAVAGLAVARFQHFASRELDPQLHSHCLVFNLALREDGQWGTVESKTFYDHKMAAGAAYRSELAKAMAEMGFEIERDDKDGFRVKGVTQEDIDKFSTRRAQILKELEKFGAKSAKAAEMAGLSTRKDKEEPPHDDLMAAWKAQGAAIGWDSLKVGSLISGNKRTDEFRPDTEAIIARLTERRSTFLERDVLKLLLVETVGHWSVERAEKETADLMKQRSILRIGRDRDGNERLTTEEMFNLEKGILDKIALRKDETFHRIPAGFLAGFIRAEEVRITNQVRSKDPNAADVVFTEQRDAIRHICSDTGGLAIVEGWAGAGKTTMLKVVNDVYAAKGFTAIGCALGGKAAGGLAKEAGIKSQTLFSLLHQLDNRIRTLTPTDVIILDEAGMVGSRMFARLQDHVNLAGAKLVAVGDQKQLQPIDAGGIMAAAMRKNGRAELSDIQRQRDGAGGQFKWLRDTVKKFADGEALGALKDFDQKGLLEIADTLDDAIGTMAAEWMADSAEGKDKLMIAATKAEVFKLNQAARALMAEDGKLSGDPVKVKTGQTTHREFQVGDRILFTRTGFRLGVKNGTLGEVLGVGLNRERGTAVFRVMTDEGNTVEFDTHKYKDIDHGFAVTCHKSQGVTIDQAYVLANENMSDRQWIYVAASRTRFKTKIFAIEQDVSESLADIREQNGYHTKQDERALQLGSLGKRMSADGAKDTSQDYAAQEAAAIAGPADAVPALAVKRERRVKGHFNPDMSAPSAKRETEPAIRAVVSTRPKAKTAGHFQPEGWGPGAAAPVATRENGKRRARTRERGSQPGNALTLELKL